METFSALLAFCAGVFTGHRWIPQIRTHQIGIFSLHTSKIKFFLLIDNPVIALSKKQADILFPAQ